MSIQSSWRWRCSSSGWPSVAKLGLVAAILSAIMVVGALRHPEIATGKPMAGTQEENLHATMLLVGLILIPPMVWLSLKRLFRRGGR
jgi:hypothetical protein